MFKFSFLNNINKHIISNDIIKHFYESLSKNLFGIKFGGNFIIKKNISVKNSAEMDVQRYWEDTALGIKFREDYKNVPGIPFIIASYNILCQYALERHPDLYYGIDKRFLNFSYRFERIVNEILQLKPHIVCLQEVEENHAIELKNRLISLNYQMNYAKRTGDKADGCAIFFNKDIFCYKEKKKIQLHQRGVKLLDRDNIALLLKLTLKSKPSKEFVVANTHLLYNPKRDDVRLAQVQLILAELEQFSKVPNGYLPTMLVGDFNFNQQSDIYQLLTTGSLEWLNNKLPTNCGISRRCVLESLGDENKNQNSPKNTLFKKENNNIITHPFNFKSILDSNHLNSRATTHHRSWIVVDHIFYTKLNKKHESDLKLLSRYLPPLVNECIKVGKIPNAALGSDHYLIAANFVLN